jgi:hypothetical protein
MRRSLTRRVVARDIAEPVSAVGEFGGAFKDVKFDGEAKWPPFYVDEEEYWVLVEENGAPKGIVYCEHMQFHAADRLEEPLAERMEALDSSALISANTPLLDVLRLFETRSCHRYYLLDGSRVTHWLEDWHLSRTPAQLAILEPLLEMEAEIEALILLTPDRYLDEASREKLSNMLKEWGYEWDSATERDRIEAMVRCAGLRQKWLWIRKHPDVVAKAIEFLSPKAAHDQMWAIAKLRDGIVHGHSVLPISPYQRLASPVPHERFRHEARNILTLLTMFEKITESVHRYVRQRTPQLRGGEWDPLTQPQPD